MFIYFLLKFSHFFFSFLNSFAFGFKLFFGFPQLDHNSSTFHQFTLLVLEQKMNCIFLVSKRIQKIVLYWMAAGSPWANRQMPPSVYPLASQQHRSTIISYLMYTKYNIQYMVHNIQNKNTIYNNIWYIQGDFFTDLPLKSSKLINLS